MNISHFLHFLRYSHKHNQEWFFVFFFFPQALCESFETAYNVFLQIFQTVPDNVGFNIELKWISQMKVSIHIGTVLKCVNNI